MINIRHVPALLIALLLAVGIAPQPSFSSEETVTLSFSRPVQDRQKTRIYEVQKGDRLVRIVMKELSMSLTDSMEYLGEIKTLNPGLENVDMLFVGQRLVLPVIDEDNDQEEPGVYKPDRASPASEKKQETREYMVRPGDTVWSIIVRTRGVPPGEFTNYLALLAAANRHIQDLNRIYPGQKLFLPGTEGAVPAGRLSSFSLSREGAYAFLADMFAVFGGEVITDGHYYVPLQPGQMTVDCAVVPVAEFSDGTRVMLDRENRIPPPVAGALMGRWNKYHILSGLDGGNTQVLLDEVVRIRDAAGAYEKEGRLVSIGRASEITVFFDALIPVGRAGLPSSTHTLGIRLLQSPEESLPPALKSFINRQGMEVIELLEGDGPLVAEDSTGSIPPLRLSEEGLGAAEDLLRMLGYSPQRDARISIYRVERDGFNLTAGAELLLEIPGRGIVITERDTLLPFHHILEERDISVVTLSEGEGSEAAIRKLASLLNLPLREDSRALYLSPEGERRGERIQFSALRLDGGEGSILFVEDDFDADLYRLLRERWNLKVVVY